MFWSRLRAQPPLLQFMWATLLVAVVAALIERRWVLVFEAVATILMSMMPVFFARRFGIRLPLRFVAGIGLFLYATIFLGEAYDFYDRYWWWDVLMHGGAAMGFGLMGFLFIFMLFEGDRYAAPAWAMAMIAFCFSVTLGALWEIFEYAMDVNFGMNMQKSGLVDTMWDLIVDVIGASFGAAAGFFYLKGRDLGGLTGVIAEFVEINRRFFRRFGRR
ncbi:hypothetical protein [Ostreiculturibacter nitratireducens]|uniref:hypothetical protein n=1 Tax=Ostreiculturibacter nitratireducens TaxID=3075226 RepID=UPI0031B5F8D9